MGSVASSVGTGLFLLLSFFSPAWSRFATAAAELFSKLIIPGRWLLCLWDAKIQPTLLRNFEASLCQIEEKIMNTSFPLCPWFYGNSVCFAG